ncbi:MAG: DUF2339 domain-containing protein [Deltaproteobacteria bacterium]|nr:MAG: DUF2339 domain-containing protein [Deltaproteobacteria bacterium]
MDGVIVIGLALLVVVMGGSICGIVALVKQRNLKTKLQSLENDLLLHLSQKPTDERPPPPPVKEETVFEPPPETVETPPPFPDVAPAIPRPPPLPREASIENRELTSPPIKRDRLSLEMKFGTRWLNWVGIIMLLAGIAFFLKYAYDNAWIGPKGRLAIGTLCGIVLVIFGERFRRKNWLILFKVLTGGGLASFYLCIFFSFQIYNLSTQTFAMILAILVTSLAVLMAVTHNAMSIVILALIGGFLSPVLLSTGENHPYALFTYIAILDLVAIGSAYFRRWRALDLLCFIGTGVMYQGWYHKFYAWDQMTPALLYISLFFLMFLLVPTFYSLVKQVPETREGLTLIVVNAVFSFFCYYQVLFNNYRYLMGFVVLGQAALVLFLFQLWSRRVGKQSLTAGSLLIVSLALVTIAIPIQLKLYGIPIAWSMEGVVLIWLGIRFRHRIPRVSGVFALILAAGGLVNRLPLHKAIFTPLFNVPVGSWVVVIAMACTAAYSLYKKRESDQHWNFVFTWITSLLGLALACGLFTLEVSQFWTLNHRILSYRTYQYSSLVVLWSVIPALTAYIFLWKWTDKRMHVSWACFAIGGVVFLGGLTHYRLPSSWLMINYTFAPKLFFILVLWWCARLCRKHELNLGGNIMELAGHGLLALLLAFEFERWGRYSDLITKKMGMSLISAGWAVQAVIVIWIGLTRRNTALRYTGFILFAFAIAKTLLIDMSEFEKVYRIVSFVTSGLLLVCAGYFYQRYSSMLMDRSGREAPK